MFISNPEDFGTGKVIWTGRQDSVYTRINEFHKEKELNFKVITFVKSYTFPKDISSVEFCIYADTRYHMYINGKFEGRGPVCAGGDYGMAAPMEKFYYSTYNIPVCGNKLDFDIKVRLGDAVLADTSYGRGCFVMGGNVVFADGSKKPFGTDESWMCAEDMFYPRADMYDYTATEKTFENAVITDDDRKLAPSEIPLLAEDKIQAVGFEPFMVNPGESKRIIYEYDKIYSAFMYLDVKGDTRYEAEIYTYEFIPEQQTEPKCPKTENIVANGAIVHMGHVMRSVGTMVLSVKNTGNKPLKVRDFGIYYSHYPTKGDNGYFKCSDTALNRIWELCRHTLEICRQTIHLDSPLHQENLGCAGDYFIESLMSYYCFEDKRLSRFDIARIGDCLILNNGRAFHTTYSFIWVQMLYDYFMYSGDESIIYRSENAVKALLTAAYSWTDETGLIDSPPNFMFVDWTVSEDGFSRHHPPKSMGQSVMNAFYYNALCCTQKLFAHIGKDTTLLEKEAIRVKDSFNAMFWNEERKLYTDGLTTPTPKEKIGNFMPENKTEISYTMYPNILACLYGIYPGENAAELLERVLYSEELQPVQMYFMHFAIEALYKTGLFSKYGLNEIRRWKNVADECPKGLKEGWIHLHYLFDYSHAWGGTPMYQLPSKIAGLEILEPGMKKIRINPELCGLDNAEIVIPSPYGAIKIEIDNEVRVLLPDEIELDIQR